MRLLTKTEVNSNGLVGTLEIRRITPYDTGNYSCVPSYAIPDWAQVHIMHGTYILNHKITDIVQFFEHWLVIIISVCLSLFIDEQQNGVFDGVSEVKIDASAAKKRGSAEASSAPRTFEINAFYVITSLFYLKYVHYYVFHLLLDLI